MNDNIRTRAASTGGFTITEDNTPVRSHFNSARLLIDHSSK